MTLAEIARALGFELRGDGGVEITDVAPLESATPGTITFLSDRKLAHLLATTRASAVILPPEAPDPPMPTLRAHHPYLAFVGVVELLRPPKRTAAPGVHPTAIVARTARIGPRASLGPHVTVGERTTIGADAVLQGNLDPAVVFSSPEAVTARVDAVLESSRGLAGHIFNLGHGVLPDSDPEVLAAIVRQVHERTAN